MMLIKIKRVHRELQINVEGIFLEKKKQEEKIESRRFGRIIYLHTHHTA